MTPPSEAQLVKYGQSLREIDPSALQQDDDSGPVRWFLGDGGTEIFAWLDESGCAQHVQLVFARVSVEWSRAGGLKTGSFSGMPATSGGRYDAYLLNVARQRDPLVCRAALTVMTSSRIAAELFAPFTEALQQAAESQPAAN